MLTNEVLSNIPISYLNNHKKIIFVGMGKAELGSFDTIFESEGFASCSALIIKNRANFGFIHLMSSFRARDFDMALSTLQDGQAIIISGTNTSSKDLALELIEDRYGITLARAPIVIDTIRPGVGNMHFCVRYNTTTDLVSVGRVSRNDEINFFGFTGITN